MKRSMCGLVILAAATGLWSCAGDPTDNLREGGDKILADPSSMFLDEGGADSVVVELVDGQGNQLDADFQPQNVGPEIAVERDTAYLETSTGTPIQTSERFIITGVSPGATSFELAAGGQTITIPVKVIPGSLALTFSNPTPAANEAVTVTAEGFTFQPDAFLTFGEDDAVTLSVAEDGSSITILPPPGVTTAPVVNNVQVNFAPGAPLVIPSTTELAVAPATPLAGTSDPSTAPAIPVPAVGETSRFYDSPDLATSADAFYKITVPAGLAGVTVTLNWSGGADMDLIEGPLACTSTFSSTDCNFSAATTSKPESATYTLAPGTYYLIAELFGGAAPPWIYLEITAEAP